MAPFCYPSERRKYGTDYRPCRSYSFKMAYLYRRGSIYICRNRRGFTQHDHPDRQKKSGMYELDLTLRNNITTEEHPLGVYHPHEELHHIKKKHRSDRSNGSRRSSCKTQRRDGTSKRYIIEKKTSEAMIKLQNTQTGQMPFIRVRQCYRRNIETDFGTGSRKKYFAKVTRRRRCI